jgi:hypothetical protein
MPARPQHTADLPATVTPLSVISYLRSRLDAESHAGSRERIVREITELERRCFSAEPNPPSEAELVECMARLRAPSSV